MTTQMIDPPRQTGLTAWTLRADLWVLVLLSIVAGGALAVAYGLSFPFVCRAELPAALCQTLSLAGVRSLFALVLMGFVAIARPALLVRAGAVLRPRLATPWLWLAAAGLALIALPLAVFHATGSHVPVPLMVSAWLGGLSITGLGLLLALCDPARFRLGDVTSLWPFALAALLGMALPDLAEILQPLWKIDALAKATFDGVAFLLTLLGQNILTDPATVAIAIDDFVVLVGKQCSGVEGFALLSVFTVVFLGLFRDRLRLSRAWILLPIALVLSWCLNIVRIAVLLLIGRYVSPELAVEGFHSHAGWLVFMTLAIGIACAGLGISWFRKPVLASASAAASAGAPTPRQIPFFQDRAVAYILPFAIFMASATLVSAISETPAILYPARMAMVLGVLALVWPVIRGLDWRLDPLALATGVLCGLAWVWTAPAAGQGDAALAARLDSLPAIALAAWVAIRLLGTALVVPLIEETFFRGYLLQRLNLGGLAWTLAALTVSTVAFAALHDRYVAGALAGLLFGLLYLRSGRLSDAVVSHAGANMVIALATLQTGNFALI